VVPSSIKVPAAFEYVFPAGCLLVSVEKATDWDRRDSGDDQARDKETGERVWTVTVMDLHQDDSGGFRQSKEVKVKVVAPVQPVPPTPAYPGIPPLVAFTDMVLVPWVDSNKCTGKSTPHKCRARLSWSIKASGMVAASELAGVA
jgi:hypothetical protein